MRALLESKHNGEHDYIQAKGREKEEMNYIKWNAEPAEGIRFDAVVIVYVVIVYVVLVYVVYVVVNVVIVIFAVDEFVSDISVVIVSRSEFSKQKKAKKSLPLVCLPFTAELFIAPGPDVIGRRAPPIDDVL